ncbi:hypothetical protein C7S16_4850 [Burkholderia thailandensis]|uniref:Uncharacterized protein n=1 Tax=Burkholderia thailandensis TaxID=57975 RepID=A0AAW9CSN5_BURTH|nr:hypothetical protein [Burkholderia thailandensis]
MAAVRQRVRDSKNISSMPMHFSFHAIRADIAQTRNRRTCFPCNPHGIAHVRRGGRAFHLHASHARFVHAREIAAARTTMVRCTSRRT